MIEVYSSDVYQRKKIKFFQISEVLLKSQVQKWLGFYNGLCQSFSPKIKELSCNIISFFLLFCWYFYDMKNFEKEISGKRGGGS